MKGLYENRTHDLSWKVVIDFQLKQDLILTAIYILLIYFPVINQRDLD